MKDASKNLQQANNILVTCGTGKTGRRVVDRLKTRDITARIGSRAGEPPFDWENPETWAGVLDGMDTVYITYHPDLAIPGARKAIEGFTSQAVKSGIQKMVLLSGKGEKEAELCEQVVMNAGADWTIVRASWFNQNFSESFLLDPILAGHIALPMPDARIPFVDTGDIAEVVVEALINDAHNGKTYEITGPRAMTFEEVVAEIADVTGRDLKYQAVSLEEYSGMMKTAGLPSDYIWLFDYLFREVLSKESNQVVTSDVERVLGRKPTDFRDYVQKMAKTGVWNL